MLGLMFMLIGMLVVTGTYIIFAYVIIGMMNDPIHDTSAMMMIIPGVLLVIFLVLAIWTILKILQGAKWRRMYIVSMIVFVISIAICYVGTPEPLKDLLYFTIFCFIFSTIFTLFGFNRMKKRQANKGLHP